MTAARILAVAAAAAFVVAFALGTLLPPDLSLGAELLQLDSGVLARAHAMVVAYGSETAWQHVAMPFLIRPLWMLPAMLGLIFGGISVTLGTRRTQSSRRRRS